MSTKRPQPTGPNKPLIIGVVVGVIVLALVAVYFTASGDDDSDVASDGGDAGTDQPSEYGVVTVEGGALPQLGDGDDPAVGMTPPGLLSERADGQVAIEPGAEDQATMVVFLAHWCPHCQAELPLLVEMQDDGAFDDLRTVAVLTGTSSTQPNFPPSDWLDDEGWTGDRFFDDEDSSAAAAYGLTSYPMMVFLDVDGTVVQRLSGEQPREVVQAAVDAATAT